jgi:hypothetical protein
MRRVARWVSLATIVVMLALVIGLVLVAATSFR